MFGLTFGRVPHEIPLTLYGPALPKSNTNKINYLGHINSFQKKKFFRVKLKDHT